MVDLPDYHSYVTPVTVNVPAGQESLNIIRPKGGELASGSVTTTSAYVSVASHVVTDGLALQLSRLIISCECASWIKYQWDGEDISVPFLLDDRSVLVLHFPWDWKTMTGDGVKKFDVLGKYYEEAGTLGVEISGEEA